MRAAIALHLAGVDEDGEPIPGPPGLACTSSARRQ